MIAAHNSFIFFWIARKAPLGHSNWTLEIRGGQPSLIFRMRSSAAKRRSMCSIMPERFVQNSIPHSSQFVHMIRILRLSYA